MRWVGIDEAGYGPNLGPLVMTAVVAEGTGERPPQLWDELAPTVARAGGPSDRLWVDDSKAILKGGKGREHLDATCLAAVEAAGAGFAGASTLASLLQAIGAGSYDDVELSPWLEGVAAPAWPPTTSRRRLQQWPENPLHVGVPWRICAVKTVVMGPAQFNAALERLGSKARVHFLAFGRLLQDLWTQAGDGTPTVVRSDKHGGRHFYLEPLQSLFEGLWIDRGPEGPALSRYTVRGDGRTLELSLLPRADAEDGLVALASIVSKAVRELWMDSFNAHWRISFPDLRPTAGYPVDAKRFRQVIEPECQARGLPLSLWWRAK